MVHAADGYALAVTVAALAVPGLLCCNISLQLASLRDFVTFTYDVIF